MNDKRKLADAVFNYLGVSTADEFIAWYRGVLRERSESEPVAPLRATEGRPAMQKIHEPGCPAWSAWDIEGACKCTPRMVRVASPGARATPPSVASPLERATGSDPEITDAMIFAAAKAADITRSQARKALEAAFRAAVLPSPDPRATPGDGAPPVAKSRIEQRVEPLWDERAALVQKMNDAEATASDLDRLGLLNRVLGDPGVGPPIGSAIRDIALNRERYVRAWLAETGLVPSQCEIVERLTADGLVVTIQKSSSGSSTPRISRVEVIDHRKDGPGRILVLWGIRAEISMQDQGRTAKVFVTDAALDDDQGETT